MCFIINMTNRIVETNMCVRFNEQYLKGNGITSSEVYNHITLYKVNLYFLFANIFHPSMKTLLNRVWCYKHI